VRIQGVGKIKIKLHRPVEGKIKTVSIKREAGRWFVIFSVICDPSPLPPTKKAIGIDLGISTFATLSDGTEIDNPRFILHEEKRIRIANRRLARRTNRRSNRRRKAVVALQKAYAHMRNQRSDFQHKVARMLVNHYGVIAVEKLNIKGMYSNLSKSVNDAAWGMFLNKLAYKAESAGRELVRVNPRGTSQTCLCGERVPKTLKQRWHSCPACGLEGKRDYISAQLILRLGLSLRNITWPDVRASVLRESVVV
jgi:putative transposase